MNIATHVDMTLTVLTALGWKGDVKLAAKNAAYPDEVRAVEVEGLGAHVMGHNLASLCHFVVPYGDGKFGGYCWASDKSVPSLDLTHRKAVAKPEAWGFPIFAPFTDREPFAKLLHDIAPTATLEADRITYPAASSMADWAWQAYRVWMLDSMSPRKQEALDALCGWMMHKGVQDPSVPHHSLGLLLKGHSAFESDVDECWNRMKGSGKVADLLETLVKADNCPPTLTVRELAEDLATRSRVSPKRLGWYRCFWRKGWNALVKGCVLRGLTGSVQLAKLLQRP